LAQPIEKTRDWLSVDHLAGFLDHCGDAPFAAWLNFENAHPPYTAPEPYWSAIDRARVTPPKQCAYDDKPAFMRLLHETWGVNHLSAADLIEIKAAYHAQALVVDAMVGRALEMLAARGRLADTLIVFTSDHGDWAGEYGLVEKWDTAFHDDLLHVPLIVAGPGIPAGRSADAFIENVDLFPTILDLLGVRGWDTAQHGRSFAELLAGGADRHRTDVFAMGGLELEACRRPQPLDPRQIYVGKHRCLHADPTTLAEARMVRTADWKVVVRTAGVNSLYDLRQDPGELVNRWADPARAASRAAAVERLLQRTIAASPRWPQLPATGVLA
jgi:choline-sulfatase